MAQVEIYAKPGCPYCAAAKQSYSSQQIEYTEYDVTRDADKLKKMLKLNGNQRRVPTIVVDGSVTVGFNGS